MPILNSFLSWVMKKRVHQIELFMKYPIEVQEELLDRLLTGAAKTQWGKQYDFKSVKTVLDFKNRLPVQDYEDIKPYVKRLQRGEKDLLWPGITNWFAKSSGTTEDRSKYIPLTRDALVECHFKGGKDMLSIYCNNHLETEIFSGKGLMLGGSHQINPGSDTYSGDLSAIIINNLPFWADVLKTPDSSIALMDNWEEKLDKIANATWREDVTSIAGVPSWMLKLLNRILEISGKGTILEVWPNLEVYFHGAVNFEPYRIQYDELIGSKKINYLELYNASEGFFGIQDQSDVNEMLLMLDYGIYYEFIPMSEIDREHPRTCSLNEVELGVNYAVVISTNSGLWRYKIGDTVQFTSLSPFRIIVSGRTKHFINAFGEEIIIENAEKSISIACARTNARITEYTAAPIYLTNKSAGGHEWLIEFEKEPDSLEDFTRILDDALKSMNSDYDAKRSGDIALQMPLIKSVKKNTFYNWMKVRNRLGGQNKVPRLSNHRKYIDEIKLIAQAE